MSPDKGTDKPEVAEPDDAVSPKRERARERARIRRMHDGEREIERLSRGTRLYKACLILIALLIVGTVAGLVILRPGPQSDDLEVIRASVQTKTFGARITEVRQTECEFGGTCVTMRAELKQGPDSGDSVKIQTSPESLSLPVNVGDDVRLIPLGEAGVTAGDYAFADFQRTGSLTILAVLFVSLIALLSGFHGLRALVGLGVSLLLIVYFVVPAMLAGKPIYAVAVVGAMAVMLSTIILSHGFGHKTIAAVLGAAASLLLTMALAWIFTQAGHLSGFTTEEASLLKQGGISLRGLLLAGMIIGTMGVLDDVTVSQASTVIALRRANPAMRFHELFRSALTVGRDHIAATVNTLVLAYAGSSLSVLIILSIGRTNFFEAVNNEIVAQEIIAMLVGSIGLIAAMPLTTALAAALATQVDPDAISQAEAHAHTH